MTNPHPQPDPNHPFNTAEPAVNTAAPRPTLALEAQANPALEDEIRLLRQRGLSDDCIHGLFSGFNIEATPEPSGQQWSIPANDQLIGLIWGRGRPTH